MSLDSPADIIPFKRFLECRERLHHIAAAKGTVVMPESTDLGVHPDLTGTASVDHGESPRCIPDRPRGDGAWRHGQV